MSSGYFPQALEVVPLKHFMCQYFNFYPNGMSFPGGRNAGKAKLSGAAGLLPDLGDFSGIKEEEENSKCTEKKRKGRERAGGYWLGRFILSVGNSEPLPRSLWPMLATTSSLIKDVIYLIDLSKLENS